jgi:hypothetical protein
MFSWKTSPNLKVIGAEGHSPESLRDEVARGATFVIYSYNISLLVISFKRPSGIHFIKPGQSRVLKGLPYTLCSLLLGWWGIPWGIVYTIQSLATNLRGGVDVTAPFLASLAPPPAAGQPPVPPPLLRPARAPVSARRILAITGVIAALAAIVYPGICFVAGENLPVALVSGLKAPYSVELNGTRYQLSSGAPVLLTLAEGDFLLRGSPGESGEQRFTVHTPFFTRPFAPQVLVVNPDRAAVVYREVNRYYPTGSTPAPRAKADYGLAANQAFHLFAKPDFFFTDFPATISMSSGTSMVEKSHIAVFKGLTVDVLAPLVSEKLGYDALRDYLTIQARFAAEDEMLQRIIFSQLKHDDARRLFESRLADRPVLVEWHRAYQFFMDSFFPSFDLAAAYRRRMEAEPDDGALIYLYARQLRNPVESHPLYAKALRAKRPSAYAAYALATDAFADAHFAESLELFQQAERAGLQSKSLNQRVRDTLLALGRRDELSARLHQQRARSPTDTELFVDELLLTQSQHPDRAAGQRAIGSFVSALRGRYGAGADFQPISNYLASQLAYGAGDEAAFSTAAAKLDGPVYHFEAAVSRRDHVGAARALGNAADLPSRFHWILMLTAQAAGDAASAEKYFAAAIATLEKSDYYSREVVHQIAANTAASHAEVLRTPNYADELRIMFTALGVRFPAQRERYFARARELDHDPAFPHLLLESVRRSLSSKAQGTGHVRG